MMDWTLIFLAGLVLGALLGTLAFGLVAMGRE